MEPAQTFASRLSMDLIQRIDLAIPFYVGLFPWSESVCSKGFRCHP